LWCYASDRNGLVLASILTLGSETTGADKIYLLIFNKDHELVSEDAIMETTIQVDFIALYQFKSNHGWSFRY
jgi:hypothetical protein